MKKKNKNKNKKTITRVTSTVYNKDKIKTIIYLKKEIIEDESFNLLCEEKKIYMQKFVNEEKLCIKVSFIINWDMNDEVIESEVIPVLSPYYIKLYKQKKIYSIYER